MPFASPHSRAGFTLVEILVALVVLTVGLLSIARGMVGLQYHARRAALRVSASAATASRLERLSAEGCAPAAGGDSGGGVRVEWSRVGASPAATMVARGVGLSMVPEVGDSLKSARDCRPGS